MAQVIMTLRDAAIRSSSVWYLKLWAGHSYARLQRRHTSVAPSALAGDLVRRGGAPPGGEDAGYVVRLEHRRGCWIGGDLLPRSGIARAVIRNAAGRVEFDRLERAHEGPAQTKSVFQRDVEVL